MKAPNLKVLPSEQLDAHDSEDEPEDETHKQHIEDRGNRLH